MSTGRRTNAHLIFFLTRSQSVWSSFRTQKTLHRLIIQKRPFTYSDPRMDPYLKYFECIAIASSSYLLRIVSTCRQPSMWFYTIDASSVLARDSRVPLWLRFSRKRAEVTLMCQDGTENEVVVHFQ